MFSSFKGRFGVPGVISVIALVFAMFGGAYAAVHHKKSKVIITKLNQIKPSVQRQLHGSTGPAGPQGPAGSAGAKGDKGDAGTNGSPGANGAPGADGESVEAIPIVVGEPGCEELGGVEVKEASAVAGTEICNGRTGFTATLPEGETETGFWTTPIPSKTFTTGQAVTASFAIPLGASLDAAHIHRYDDSNFTDFDEGGPETIGCKGNSGEPTAPSGHICIYQGVVLGVTLGAKADSLSKAGGILFTATNTGSGIFNIAEGTWAVTG